MAALQAKLSLTGVREVSHHGQMLLGVSERVRWFRRGLESGEQKACDTFVAVSL